MKRTQKPKANKPRISKDDGEKIKKAQLANAINKVQAGKSLTLGEQRLIDESTGDTQDEEIPQKSYDSLAGIVSVFGLNRGEVSAAKKEGCPAFRNGRIYTIPLIRWLNKESSSDPTEEHVGKWSEELCRVKTLRERIRLAEDEGRVMDFANVVTGLQSVMSILFGRLDRMANQLPPSLKGLDELAIMRVIQAETEELRRDIKAKFSETTKGKEAKNV